MSNVREPQICRLVWNDGDLAGVEILLRVMHLDQLLALGDLAQLDVGELQAGRISPDSLDRFHRLTEAFGDALLAWNLHERHPITGIVAPVPATPRGLRSQDSSLILLAAVAWMDVLSGSRRPAQDEETDEGANLQDEIDEDLDGETSPEEPTLTPDQVADLPMEVLAS